MRPKSFLLSPAGEHGHRLVIDLYPEADQPADEQMQQAIAESDGGQRDMIVAIDAGHGGEDPGAIGPSGTYEKNVTLAVARQLHQLIENEPRSEERRVGKEGRDGGETRD